jgi:hypothetical protein
MLNRKNPNAGKHIIFASKPHQNFRMVVCDDISTYRQPLGWIKDVILFRILTGVCIRISLIVSVVQGINSVADPGFLSMIPDPNFFHPGSRIKGQKNSGSRDRIRIK